MARTPILVSRCSITTLILILNNTLVNSNCFSIRLIHPYSPESPLFESNLTHVQRIKSLVSQSKIRAYNLAKTRNWSSIIQAPIDVQVFLYIVKLGIGTFKSKPSYKEYYLVMDTGSDLLWMQCEGCTNCFEQTPRPFPKDNSSSFRPVLVENKPSHYEFVYEDGDGMQGILARETFYLRSNNGGLVKIKDVEFGCGLKNDVKYRSYKNKIAEITGLGWQDLSFVQQISPQINGKFSYCLPVLLSGNTSNTYLRFGDQKIQTKNSKTTPLYRKKDISTYYVQLQGISVNGTKLKINPKVFMFNTNDSSGGCIIDSGTPHSRIISPAFYLLKLELKNHFSRMKAFKKIKVDFGLELCYGMNKREGLNKLPDATLHLRGSQADFVMKPEAVFEVAKGSRALRFREIVCLATIRSKEVSIIGSHQQTNQRIVHDTKNKKLIFYPQDCSQNP